jgi:hypothetical protein
MKVHGKLLKETNIIIICLVFCVSITNAQNQFKTFLKSPVPIVANKLDFKYEGNPYASTSLDYHEFKEEGESQWAATQGDWYLKYKAMYDFRCREPFIGVTLNYQKKNYLKSGYLFRLVDNQMIEDSIPFLISKYFYNSADTLKKWNLPSYNDDQWLEKIIKRLGIEHFKMVECVFDHRKYAYFIDVPEAEQANDIMVEMRLFKYPADVDIFLFNFAINNWEYVESVTVSGDHELELYVLNKFEPRYLQECEEVKTEENESTD